MLIIVNVFVAGLARQHLRVLTDDWAPIEWYVDKTLFAFFGS